MFQIDLSDDKNKRIQIPFWGSHFKKNLEIDSEGSLSPILLEFEVKLTGQAS